MKWSICQVYPKVREKHKIGKSFVKGDQIFCY